MDMKLLLNPSSPEPVKCTGPPNSPEPQQPDQVSNIMTALEPRPPPNTPEPEQPKPKEDSCGLLAGEPRPPPNTPEPEQPKPKEDSCNLLAAGPPNTPEPEQPKPNGDSKKAVITSMSQSYKDVNNYMEEFTDRDTDIARFLQHLDMFEETIKMAEAQLTALAEELNENIEQHNTRLNGLSMCLCCTQGKLGQQRRCVNSL